MPATYCDLSTNRCVAGCERDVDCLNSAQICSNGLCEERGCSRNYQCAFGQVCDVASQTCVDAVGRHCESGCDPMTENACGTTGQMCLGLQDDEGNAIGDFCFEPCLAEPNRCPVGYGCTEIEDQDMSVVGEICFRDCAFEPGQ